MKIWARWPYTPVGCISLQNASSDRTLLRKSLLAKENIPNILEQTINKTQGGCDQIENDKNDNANYAPSYHMEGLPMAQVAIFKEIFDQVRKI